MPASLPKGVITFPPVPYVESREKAAYEGRTYKNDETTDKLNGTQYLSDQDGLTKDRVKIASSYIPKQAIKILDVGAGYGFVEELLEKDDRLKIYGIDISQEGVQLLSKRFQGEFKTGIVH